MRQRDVLLCYGVAVGLKLDGVRLLGSCACCRQAEQHDNQEKFSCHKHKFLGLIKKESYNELNSFRVEKQ